MNTLETAEVKTEFTLDELKAMLSEKIAANKPKKKSDIKREFKNSFTASFKRIDKLIAHYFAKGFDNLLIDKLNGTPYVNDVFAMVDTFTAQDIGKFSHFISRVLLLPYFLTDTRLSKGITPKEFCDILFTLCTAKDGARKTHTFKSTTVNELNRPNIYKVVTTFESKAIANIYEDYTF